MVSCGEASGDLYSGALAAALRQIDPGTRLFGFGGERLRSAGADLIGDYRRFAVTGLSEAVAVLPRSWRMLRQLGEAAEQRRPDVFVAVDFPDFNFRLLPVMKKLGVPIVYYVSPQVWAWRPGRLETLRRYVDRMLVIFPFEAKLYEEAGVPVEFVGHPLIDLAKPTRTRGDLLPAVGFDPALPVLALLPGSRANEVRRILPRLLAASSLTAQAVPGIQVLIARAPSLEDNLFEPVRQARAGGLRVATLEGGADDVLASSDVVVTASGTATVQSALHGRPMVIVYRLSPLTYTVGRSVVRVSTYGMVNLVAGRTIVPELIQDRFTPEAVAREAVSLLTDNERAETMRRDLAEMRSRLGGSGASQRAAAAVLKAGSVLHRSGPTA